MKEENRFKREMVWGTCPKAEEIIKFYLHIFEQRDLLYFHASPDLEFKRNLLSQEPNGWSSRDVRTISITSRSLHKVPPYTSQMWNKYHDF